MAAVVQPATATPTAVEAAASPSQTPSKIPTMLRDAAAQAGAAVSAKRSMTASPQTRALDVDSRGRIGVQINAAAPVTAQQEASLTSLGVTVQTNSADFKQIPGADLPNTGLVSASVPYDKLD